MLIYPTCALPPPQGPFVKVVCSGGPTRQRQAQTSVACGVGHVFLFAAACCRESPANAFAQHVPGFGARA
eukprot:10096756-Lingulodinium_polyedra.AAC.1